MTYPHSQHHPSSFASSLYIMIECTDDGALDLWIRYLYISLGQVRAVGRRPMFWAKAIVTGYLNRRFVTPKEGI